MQTKQIYYTDPYKFELDSKVLSIEPSGNLFNIILDQTIFFPEGGGQPSDRGTIGDAKVEYVRNSNGEIIHQTIGSLDKGQEVKLVIDWDWRYKYMKIHTAGHLIHDVLMGMVKNLIPLKGGHGKKAFLEYTGNLDIAIKENLESEVNRLLQQDLPVATHEVNFEELEKECPFLPANLPKDKALRIIKIGSFSAMPDGGAHEESTKEIGRVFIINIAVQDGITNLRYGVANN